MEDKEPLSRRLSRVACNCCGRACIHHCFVGKYGFRLLGQRCCCYDYQLGEPHPGCHCDTGNTEKRLAILPPHSANRHNAGCGGAGVDCVCVAIE